MFSENHKHSSGFVYSTEKHTYVFTAKHAVCGSEPEECKLKERVCDVCELKQIPKTKIKIDKPDFHGFKSKKVEQILQSNTKDLAILVLKDNEHSYFSGFPTVKVYPFNEVLEKDKFISCGYPAISSHLSIQPISYSRASSFRNNKMCVEITSDTTTNLECSKENLAGNSGCGLIKYDDKNVMLLGIYTDTGNMAFCYGEVIDHSVNELLVKNNYPPLESENVNNAFKTLIKSEFTKCFSKIEHSIEMPDNREINLYRLLLDGKGYDYSRIRKRLIECVPLFTLTRKQLKESRENNELTSSVLSSVKEFLKLESQNKVSELLLQGFLEAYLNAPKLYSSHQNEDATFQGAHIKFQVNDCLEIIHCLAMISPSLDNSFKSAVEKIMKNFPELKPFGGLVENGILDSHFSDEEYKILKDLILPTEDSVSVDYKDRLAIFIGYDRHIEDELKYMQQKDFINELESRIISDVHKSIESLKSELDKLNLVKVTIDCFFVPFENTGKFNNDFIESLE
ncbi:Hachiman antiphage defense system protein HamA [Aliivibrio fischeri]|uniref:Hachiman antiphage defense system protein HamA n=1 Tax=Aliivibrio fischeri TaxID=668 RepID=UPI003F75D864